MEEPGGEPTATAGSQPSLFVPSPLKPRFKAQKYSPVFFLFKSNIIKHVNGRLCGANKRSVPTEALNPLRFDDDYTFVIGSVEALSYASQAKTGAPTYGDIWSAIVVYFIVFYSFKKIQLFS